MRSKEHLGGADLRFTFRLAILSLFAAALPVFSQTAIPRWQTQTGLAPSWLRVLGNGVDGAYLSTDGASLSEDLQVTSFTVPAGTTITTGGLTVHSLGACRIDGTISGSGAQAEGYAGGSGGGGGGGAVILSAASSLTFSGTISVAGGAGGTCSNYSGCGAGGAGGNGWLYALAGWQ